MPPFGLHCVQAVSPRVVGSAGLVEISGLKRLSGFFRDEAADGFDHEIEVFRTQAGIRADEDSFIHDAVGPGEIADDAKRPGRLLKKVHKCRLTHEVSTEQHAVANFRGVEVLDEFRAREWRGLPHQHHEAKPGRIAAVPAAVPRKG